MWRLQGRGGGSLRQSFLHRSVAVCAGNGGPADHGVSAEVTL